MLLYITIILMCILGGAEVDIFVPSFPDLQTTFNLSPFMVELTLGVNLTAHCVTSLIVGNLGDRYGRRPIILLGLTIFVIGSLFCVLAGAYWQMLLGRLLQGIGVSGPVVLSYIVIADKYPPERQQQMMGVLNGSVGLAMACAPVLGSFVNMAYGWQGNFMVLLILGGVCLGLGIIFLPKGVVNRDVSLSLKEYAPVVKSRKAFLYILTIVLILQSYWIFIGISPIFYMEDLGVSLKQFGFYQGILAATFGIISLTSGIYIKRFGSQKCFFFSVLFLMGFLAVLPILMLLNTRNPMIITGVMLLQSLGVIFPINVLWPLMLESVPDARGRLAAVAVGSRLVVTALSIQIASYFYDGTIRSLGAAMWVFTAIGLWAGYKLLQTDQIFKSREMPGTI
jgi:DHA1 family bicyclomycin/chloramphenicol resistance-like MFS transporter